jgi:RNA polymerase sigma factor (sigma-70 family)
LATLAAPGISATARSRSDCTDHDLVQAVRAGDDHAFERLYHRYHRRIAAYLFGMVRDHGRAEDLTQEVFVSALRRMRQTDRPIAFKPWIYEIAKNASIDAFRRARRTDEVSYDADDALGAADQVKLAATSPSPDAAVGTKESLDHLCGAFGGLSEAHHQILVLRELEGLSYREIGERLGMSRASVESTLFRARRRLTEEYQELVTGERCLRIQAIIADAGHGALGTRDTRRVGSHISYCQPCRRQAAQAGLDAAVMARRPVRSKIAAFLPLPAFLRRRWLPGGSGETAAAVAGHGPALTQLSMAAATYGDSTMSGWMKGAAVATALAAAGLGAGAVERGPAGSQHDAPVVPRPAAASVASGGAGVAAAGARRAASASTPLGSIGAAATARPARAAAGGSGWAPASGAGSTSAAGGGASGGGAATGAPSDAASKGLGGALAGGGPSSVVGAASDAGSAVTRPVTSAAGTTAQQAAGGVSSGAATAVTGAVQGATGVVGAVTGAVGAGSQPLVQPDVSQLTQPAAAAPPASAGDVVKNATGAVGGTVGGQAGGAVKDAGGAAGGAVDQVTAGVGGVVGGLLGGK